MSAAEQFAKTAEQLAYLINEERRVLNRKALYAVPHLNECAMTRAREQTESEGHWRPNGDYYSEIIDWDIMQYLTSAENIALGAQSPAEVIEMWRTSSNQWAIITNAEFTHIGAGVYYDKNKWYWVALFTNPAIPRLEYPDQYLPEGQEIEYPPEIPTEVLPDMVISCKDAETGNEFPGLTVRILDTKTKKQDFSAVKVVQGDTTISHNVHTDATINDGSGYTLITFTTGTTETKIFGLPRVGNSSIRLDIFPPKGYYAENLSTSDHFYTYFQKSEATQNYSLNFLPKELILKITDATTGEILPGAVFELVSDSGYYNIDFDGVEVLQNGQPYPHTLSEDKKTISFTSNTAPVTFRKMPGYDYWSSFACSILTEISPPEGYKSPTPAKFASTYTGNDLSLKKDSGGETENNNILVIKNEKNVISFYTLQQILTGTLQELSGAEYKLSYSGTGSFTNTSSHNTIYINSAEKSISWTSTGTTRIFGLPNGSYQLEEVTTPDGFHKIENITFDLISSEVKNAVNTFGEVTDNNIKIYNRMIFDKTVSQNDYITIYDSLTKQNGFDTHGLGVLAPTECLITEVLNGKYELSITHPIDSDGKWRYIKESNIIKALGQLFTIKTVSYSYGAIKNEVTAKAEHIFYQQADWWILPEPDTEKIFFTPGSSVTTFLDTIDALATKIIIAGQTYYLYNWDSDITIPYDMPLRELPNSDGISPVGAIMDSGGLLDTIKGELYRDKFYFSIRNRMENSSDNAFEIRIGSNLRGIKRTVDLTAVCTWFKAYNNYGSWFAVSWSADSVLVLTAHSIVRSKKFSYTFEDENLTDEEKAAKADELLEKDSLLFFSKTFKPLIAYEVDIEDVQQNPDFEDFRNKPDYRVGNIGTIYDEYFGEKIQLKITKTVKDAITGKTKKVLFGETRNFTSPGYDSIVGNTPIIQVKSRHITDSSGAFVYDAENNPIVEVTMNNTAAENTSKSFNRLVEEINPLLDKIYADYSKSEVDSLISDISASITSLTDTLTALSESITTLTSRVTALESQSDNDT